MVLRSFPGFSITFSRVSARPSPSWARVCMRILLTVVMEVSADEKNAERQISMIRIRNCMASLESNNIQLLCFMIILSL